MQTKRASGTLPSGIFLQSTLSRCSVQCAVCFPYRCSVLCAVQNVQCVTCSVSVLCAVGIYVVWIVQSSCKMCCVHFVVWMVQSKAFRIQCAVLSVHFTVCSEHTSYTLLPGQPLPPPTFCQLWSDTQERWERFLEYQNVQVISEICVLIYWNSLYFLGYKKLSFVFEIIIF